MQPRHSLNLQIERLYRQSGHVAIATHALSSNLNGQTVTLSATNNLTLETTNIQAEQNVNLNAGNNLALLSGKDQYYSLTESDHKGGTLGSSTHTSIAVENATHALSSNLNGQTVTLSATNNLTLETTNIQAEQNVNLNAGNNLALLSGKDQYYSLTESDHKGGALGTTSHGRDEVTSISHVGSSITSTQGDIAMISTGNQTLEAAHLNSAGNLTLTSTQGSISFNAVKDLLQESHEHSSVNLAWQSAQGQGSTNESIVQSHFAATGQTLINAAQGVNIAIGQVDAQSVHQTIAAMVSSDPSLAWLQAEETKGNVDWQQVKTIHDSWQYEQSGLGPGAALAVAIVMSIYAGPAGASMLLGDATVAAATVAGSAAAIEVSVVSAVAAGLATNATLSLISNKGDLGAVFADITSPDAIKGYITASLTAGFTEGVIRPNLSGTAVANSTESTVINNPTFNNITHGFNLNQIDGAVGFATYTAAQAFAGATINTVVNGGSFGDNLSGSMSNAATTIAGALLFNQVGGYAKEQLDLAKANHDTIGIALWTDGGASKVVLHALVGGLLTQASGGDFATGAMAAGVSEAVSNQLATLVNNDPKLQNMAAQLIGIATTALTGGDVNAAANVASMGDLYNRQLHLPEIQKAKDLYEIAKKLGLPYTLAQIEDTLRAANNSKYGETVTSNIIYNPNAPDGLNSQSGTDMFTGQKIDGMQDSNGSWTTNPVTGQQIQNLATPSSNLIGFVQTYTGGSNSVYSWSAGISQTPTNISTNTSPAVGWNYMGANSAGLSGMPPVDNRTQAQIDADQNRFAIGVAALPVIVAAAPFVATTSTATQSVMAIGGGASFVFDTAGQYVSTNGFTTGDYRPGQAIFAGLTGAALAPLGLSWASTGSLPLNLLNSVVLGGGVAATNTTFNNYYYNENKDVGSAAVVGSAFGIIGFGVGNWVQNSIPTINPNISILLQNYHYTNPELTGNAAGATASGFGSFIDTPNAKEAQ